LCWLVLRGAIETGEQAPKEGEGGRDRWAAFEPSALSGESSCCDFEGWGKLLLLLLLAGLNEPISRVDCVEDNPPSTPPASVKAKPEVVVLFPSLSLADAPGSFQVMAMGGVARTSSPPSADPVP